MNIQQLDFPAELYGYRFRNPALLKQALTHSSTGEPDNQTLEFLGDVVRNFIASVYLFEINAETTEGELTKKRSQIVNNRNSLSAVKQEENFEQN